MDLLRKNIFSITPKTPIRQENWILPTLTLSTTVENALSKVKDEKGMKRVEKFLKEDACPDCHGSRLNERARAPKLQGITLDKACEMTLSQLITWVDNVPSSPPSGNGANGRKHLRLLPDSCKTAYGAGDLAISP